MSHPLDLLQRLPATFLQVPAVGILDLNHDTQLPISGLDQNVTEPVPGLHIGEYSPVLPMSQQPQQHAVIEVLFPAFWGPAVTDADSLGQECTKALFYPLGVPRLESGAETVKPGLIPGCLLLYSLHDLLHIDLPDLAIGDHQSEYIPPWVSH